jgi:hypothetical protein
LCAAALLYWRSLAGAPAADSPRPVVTPSPQILTEEQALAEWRRLRELWRRSYRERDPSLVDQYAAPDARPSLLRARAEIRSLRRYHLLERSVLRIENVEVVTITPNRIVVRERALNRPRFIDERTGKNRVVDDRPEIEVSRWILRLYPEGWYVYAIDLLRVRELRGR